MPPAVIETLEALGIPPEKATYVGELYTDDAGIHYQFSYRLAGTILAGPERETPGNPGHCCHEPYPYGAPDFPSPHFDLEFFAVLPWAAEWLLFLLWRAFRRGQAGSAMPSLRI